MEHLGDRAWHVECRRCREGRCSEVGVVVGRAVGITANATGMKATGKVVTTKGEELREAQVTS